MNNKLVKAVGMITVIAIASKILGFGRELLMAAYFGASTLTDAFFVASIIPVLLFTAVGMAITTGMVPLYAEAKKKSKEEASEIVSILTTIFVLGSIILMVLFYIFTPFITKLMAPGFSANQHELTNILTMIMLPSFCFFVLSAITTGILEYEQRFAPPALGAIPQNILVILTIIFLSNRYGIYGVAVATLLGAVSQFLLQYPYIKEYKVIRFNFEFRKHKQKIITTFRVFFPIVIASIAYQITAVVDRIIASGLPEGTVSALNYSNKLMFLPLSIILLSLITVLFPSIVDAAIDRGEAFVKLVFNGMKIITLVGIPITVVMLVESQALVDLAFKRGAFDTEASKMTTYAFFFYSFGMVFIALKEYLNRCFIALNETKMTMYGSVAAVLINIMLSIVLSKYLGIGGIALAFSIAMVLQTVFLFLFLTRKVVIKSNLLLGFFVDLGKLLIVFIIVYTVTDAFSGFYREMNGLILLIITTIIAFILFIVISIVLKCKELEWLIALLKSKKRS